MDPQVLVIAAMELGPEFVAIAALSPAHVPALGNIEPGIAFDAWDESRPAACSWDSTSPAWCWQARPTLALQDVVWAHKAHVRRRFLRFTR